MSDLKVEGLHRHFGAVKALSDVSFDVADGEFFCLLGPSSSGKTTTLRAIAGLEELKAGTVTFADLPRRAVARTFLPDDQVDGGSRTISDASSKAALGAALLLERIARDTYSERGPATINPTQWATIRYLRRAGEESRTPIHLAKYLGVTPAPASRTIASLERRGYVARRPNPSDRRSVLIDLTDLGLRVLREDPIARLAVAVDQLKAKDRRALETSLENIAVLLAGALRESANGRTFGD